MRSISMAVMASLAVCAACSSSSSSGDRGGGAVAPEPSSPPPGGDTAVVLPRSSAALFVLGDSLSDVGNAAGGIDYLLGGDIWPASIGLCHPTEAVLLDRDCSELLYGRSRVTDGPVAVEHVAAELALPALVPSFHVVPGAPVAGTNYAIAGAKARAQRQIDLASQIDFLLLEHAPLPADAVFVVMIGGNDLIDAAQASVWTGTLPGSGLPGSDLPGSDLPGSDLPGSGLPEADLPESGLPESDPPGAPATAAGETPEQIVTAAVDAIGAGVERLLDFGARRLIVANVPDLAALPAVREEVDAYAAQAGSSADAILAEASALSAAFNAALDARLDAIEARGQWQAPTPALIARFDLHGALDEARAQRAASGGNTLDACFDSEAYQASAARMFHPDCAPPAGGAPRFDGFLFWDGIHPTGAAHAAIGEAMTALFATQ